VGPRDSRWINWSWRISCIAVILRCLIAIRLHNHAYQPEANQAHCTWGQTRIFKRWNMAVSSAAILSPTSSWLNRDATRWWNEDYVCIIVVFQDSCYMVVHVGQGRTSTNKLGSIYGKSSLQVHSARSYKKVKRQVAEASPKVISGFVNFWVP
jgi:hypothetical protein